MTLYFWHTNPTATEAGPCPQCAALNGKQMRKNAATRPPLHPHCACEIVELDEADLKREDFPLLQPRTMLGQFAARGSSGAEIRQYFDKNFPLLLEQRRRR